ncbi:MAG: transcription repressor NadR [Clostridia bacterium]|nr:transcription repressor NadR [Clostridia bacterium]
MKVTERRKAIVNLLLASKTPISGGELSEQFNVSRQIIVQDVTILKGLGYEILSTHNGYVMQKSPLVERVYKLKHTTEETEDELNSIVDLGGTVVDVFVWHKVYGRISATLNIFSRLHVKQFLEGVRTGKSTELMNITGGYHYHTVRADSEAVLDKIGETLQKKNYIALGD